jgi:hypothetical protein
LELDAPFHVEVRDYAGFVSALRDRVEQLNISRATLDAVSGLPSGYVGKILSPYARKKIGGISFGLLVHAAGLRMELVDDPDAANDVRMPDLEQLLKAARLKMVVTGDPEALARVRPMFEPRQASQARNGHDGRARAKGYSKRKPPLEPCSNNPERPKPQLVSPRNEPTETHAHLRVIQSKRRGSKYA